MRFMGKKFFFQHLIFQNFSKKNSCENIFSIFVKMIFIFLTGLKCPWPHYFQIFYPGISSNSIFSSFSSIFWKPMFYSNSVISSKAVFPKTTFCTKPCFFPPNTCFHTTPDFPQSRNFCQLRFSSFPWISWKPMCYSNSVFSSQSIFPRTTLEFLPIPDSPNCHVFLVNPFFFQTR